MPRQNSEEAKMSAVVKMHRNEKSSALSTNATTEEEFMREVAMLLSRELGNEEVADVAAILSTSLPQIVDICCKLRGIQIQRG